MSPRAGILPLEMQGEIASGQGRSRWRRPTVIPGFGITLGVTLTWLSVIVLIPLGALFLKTTELSPSEFIAVITGNRVVHALQLSFGISLIAAFINLLFGTLVVWALVRYDFPLRRLFDAIVDIPFALPTAVAGIALAAMFSDNSFLGEMLAAVGIKVAYTPLGILVALVFIGLPFVVRTVQPVLADLEAELEDAAASLGANRWQIATRVILPAIFPAILTGFALAFARGVGEYGSVIFIAGNLPNVSEIAPLLIVIKLEEFKTADATAIAVVMLVVSFAVLFVVNRLQRWSAARGVRG
jgi:sulfate/thiosulfate transport system permease protein